jgi:transcriptional/translational regulatory protein YebC/TACO1
MFDRKGYLEFLFNKDDTKPVMTEDEFMDIALEVGAEDVEIRDEIIAQVTCDPNDLGKVRDGFITLGLEPSIAELIFNPKEFLNLASEFQETFENLLDALNENEDVNQIHHNVNE